MLNQQIPVIKRLFLQHSFLCDPQTPLLSLWLSCPQSVISPELLSQLHFQICPVEYRISAQDSAQLPTRPGQSGGSDVSIVLSKAKPQPPKIAQFAALMSSPSLLRAHPQATCPPPVWATRGGTALD